MGGEGLCELCGLPLCECRMTGPGCGRDRRPGIALRMTGFGILGRLEGGEMSGAYGIIGPALDLGPALSGKDAFAAREHRGQAIERVAFLMPQTGPCQTRGDGPEAVADGDRARQIRLLERGPHPGHHRGIIVRCRGCGTVEPGHRIGRGGAGVERADDGERGRLVGRVCGAGQDVARGIDRGGVLVPFARAALPSQVGSAMPDPVPNGPQSLTQPGTVEDGRRRSASKSARAAAVTPNSRAQKSKARERMMARFLGAVIECGAGMSRRPNVTLRRDPQQGAESSTRGQGARWSRPAVPCRRVPWRALRPRRSGRGLPNAAEAC